MNYEATGDDHGNYFISNEIGDVLKIPVLSIRKKLTVCEFTRLDPSICLETIIKQIRSDALYVFLDGYDSEMLELVDLDNQTWTRVSFHAGISEMAWVDVKDEWPPGIGLRKTALEGAPRPSLDIELRVDGHRFKWTAACPSLDGNCCDRLWEKRQNLANGY